jgi:hypothetical protein
LGAPPQSKLEGALRSGAQDFTGTYVIIDGLDECPSFGDDRSGQDQRRALLELLETIHGWNLPNFHLLVTSRREQDIADSFQKLVESQHAQVLDLAINTYSKNVNGDIGLFIDEELEKGIFQRLSKELKNDIKNGLVDKADGVYVTIYLAH